MLSISNVSSVGQAGSYYAADNYYTEGESREYSQWEGEGAKALGLEGKVDPDAFKEVLSGRVDGQELGRGVGVDEKGVVQREHRPGYDVTLSAPKSVSILAEVGGLRDVREAHEKAASTVLKYIESNLAGARVTKDGVTSFEKTGNVVVAKFEHNTSRSLDPQTHTHMVFANATQTSDGVWRSLSNEGLYKNQKLLGKMYDTELAANLRQAGYRLEPTEKGGWEIAGVSKAHIDEFSQRTKDIDAKLESMGLTRETASADQREKAALATRATKSTQNTAEVMKDWKERAQGIDFAGIVQKAERDAAVPVDPQLSIDRASLAVSFALSHLGEREAVVAHGDIKVAALDHILRESSWAGVRHGDIDMAIGQAVARGDALLVGSSRDGESLVSTPLALEREQKMLALMESGKGQGGVIEVEAKVDEAVRAFEARKSGELNTEFKLTEGQHNAAVLVLTSEDRYVGLQGYAGVGKTTMMELVNDVATQAGYKVVGMASSAEAAATLQAETGIASSTTASFLIKEDAAVRKEMEGKTIEVSGSTSLQSNDIGTIAVKLPGKDAPDQRKELWVVDEGSLAGQREVTAIMEMAERVGAKVAFSGDKLQLNAVEAGKPFEQLLVSGIAQAEMTEINRQKVTDLKEAVAAAVQRDNARAFDILEKRVVEISDKQGLFERVTADILSKQGTKGADTLLIVPLNSDRQAINESVRAGLQARGDIGPDVVKQGVLVNAGFSEVQKSSFAYYEAGMEVRFGRDHSRSMGIKAGEYALVQGVDSKTRLVTLKTQEGQMVQWNPAKNNKVEVYKVEERSLAVGDQLRITRNNKELGLNNGTLAVVKSLDSQGLTVEAKGKEVQLSGANRSHAHLDYAYSMTVYASQGKTVNESALLITSDSGRAIAERAFMVGITREKEAITIYTDNKVKALDLIQRSVDKSSVIESMQAVGNAGIGQGNSVLGASLQKGADTAGDAADGKITNKGGGGRSQGDGAEL